VLIEDRFANALFPKMATTMIREINETNNKKYFIIEKIIPSLFIKFLKSMELEVANGFFAELAE
jgi:hypothetical protein